MTEMKKAPFDAVAKSYEKYIVPMFQDTAQDLIELAALQAGQTVLDVGTGPGVAALLAALKVAPTGSVVGVDVSEEMLAIARKKTEQAELRVEFQRANVESLDLPEGSFDVVLSSLGLATTDPDKSLPSIRRVLKAGGRLVFSQWGPSSRPAKILVELLQKRRVAKTTPHLEWLRTVGRPARPWRSRYNTPEAMASLLTAHGFNNVQTEMRAYTFTYPNSDAYLDSSRSFPLLQAEFEAMSPGNQRMFRHEFNAAMAPFRGPNRSIISEDEILFAVAQV